MNVSILLAHPRPKSFNHALAAAVVAALRHDGHAVCFHDLYAERFDPLLPYEEIRKGGRVDPRVAEHCAEIGEAEGLVFVHPNWWGQPPAILKGWVDRVLRAGVGYEFSEGDLGEGIPLGLLKARTAVVLNTSNTSPEREREVFGDPLETLWKDCILRFCGVPGFVRRTYGVMVTSTAEQRAGWLADASEVAVRAFSAQT
ncbi:MAG: NAD(P)H-dependent oxidoreductase [Deltaproteobacteria bacterium]|nr:NAD(P)H-dependent oxidoreductase [Deltaproteobacteria bacterium]